jgi:sugar (pentulose or hexulose) kinase
MSFIGIDLGTSFIKGAVLDLDTFRLKQIQRVPFPDPIPGLPALYREFDPDKVLQAIRSLLKDLLPDPTECEGLVMCSQMHGLVFTTEQGEPRSNLTTWQDQRVLMPHPSGRGTFFDNMLSRISLQENRQLGNELRPGQPIGLLYWLAEQGLLPTGDVILASLPDFVLSNLCGTPAVTETTHAMSHGALNLEALGWHHDVLSNLGLAGLHWPIIRPHGSLVGKLEMGGRSIPCYTPVGDYQCALVGALLRYGELSLNISTGSQVSLLKSHAVFGDFQTRPFFDGRFLIGITHIPAGRSLNLLVKLLTELAEGQKIEIPDPWPYIIQAAAGVAGRNKDLHVNLAFFNSSCGDHGEITHIREEELSVGHLFRAAFQNMADNYYASALRLSPEKEWSNLVFSGGLAQKIPVLREMILDKFQVGYRICPTTEDTLLGLLALALVFSRRLETVAEATELLRKEFKD